MNDDALRERLARLDPAASPADPVSSRWAHELLERTMANDLSDHVDSPTAAAPGRRPGRLAVLSAAAAAAVVAGAAAVLAGGAGTGEDRPAQATTTRLSLPDPLAMSSCVVFSTDVLRDMPVAFAGTVTSVEGDTVTLDVTHWYKGGSADAVVLETPGEHTSASLDAVQLEDGKDYLVTATEGTVNGCGFSGPATAELSRAFDEAFGG